MRHRNHTLSLKSKCIWPFSCLRGTHTCNVQMFEVDTRRHQLEESDIRDVWTARHLQLPQLRTALGYRVEAFIRQLLAAVQVDLLNHDAHGRRVDAETTRQNFQRFVDVRLLVVDANTSPQRRFVREVVPASAHAAHATHIIAR